jgi:hypothetical protein
MSVWDKPRVIGCAENFPQQFAIPRGCLEAATELMVSNGIRQVLIDERCPGTSIKARFEGSLRHNQHTAVDAMLRHECGVLCAPTAFGKTVTASALIAARGIHTLVLVHRAELLDQWVASLRTFLSVDGASMGSIGAGQSKPTGIIDVAHPALLRMWQKRQSGYKAMGYRLRETREAVRRPVVAITGGGMPANL